MISHLINLHGSKLYIGHCPETLEEIPIDVDLVINLRTSNLYNFETNKEIIYEPIPDGYFPDRTWLLDLLKKIDDELKLGKNILVHCLLGQSRSGLVCTAYLMKYFFCSDDYSKAINFVRDKHPPVQLNTFFADGLKHFKFFL